MGIVVTFKKSTLAERVARQYGYQVRRLLGQDGAEARDACLYLGRAFVFQCFDPSGRRPETDYFADPRDAWRLACAEVWGDRFVARHGQAMQDRYDRNNGGLSSFETAAA